MTRSDAGTIRQVGDHRWRVEVESGRYADGRRRRVSRNVRGSYRDAVKVRTELLQTIGHVEMGREDMTFAQFVEAEYLPHSREHHSPTTTVGYESSLKVRINPVIGHLKLRDIRAAHLRELVKSVPTAGAAEKAYKTARQVLRFAVELEYIDEDHDPTTKRIRLPKKKSYTPAIIRTSEEIERLLETFRGHRCEAIVLVIVGCGLRRSEACGLWWRDIDLKRGTVVVNKTLIYAGGEVVARDHTKTKHSTRTLVLPPFIAERLREIRSFGALYPDASGQRMNPESVSQSYRRHCAESGIPFIPLKNLRNAYLTFLVKSGVDPVTAAAMAGHSDPGAMRVLYEHYFVPDEEIFRAAQEKYSAGVRRAGG